ncbi:AhpC/TSA family protein [Maribacter algarum]|uniref:thioredoxin-dependent peroxiredoxin n=1 Tax=Maribacter algarum (ex Zhang et al. 2020) TaxID=2578118 RepID=A0A5S3PN58_9FLAO|nr:peroxiredoxin-like family protein [Maribacter algarum]TMM55791.1 AhpC/TSA family protein [Maribacter algarum]
MTLQEQLEQMRNATMERMPRSIIKVFTDSIAEIRKNQLKENALKVGDHVPDMNLQTINGHNSLLSDLIEQEFLILNFYRGGWCPYCNMELREYERLRKAFNELDADIVGISAEIPELAVKTSDKNALSFPVLTDFDAELMKAIGIVFQLDEASKKEFENFGMDFTRVHGNNNFELPVPAVYVINRKMEVVFVHFEEDYMTRLEPTELLNILKNNLITEKI